MWLWQGHPSPMPGWGRCGGPSLQEQQCVPWTPLLASPKACDLLAERKVHRSAGHMWLWQLWASCVTQAGHKHRCTVPLCPCQPGQDPWAGPSPSGTELSLTTERLSLSASCGPCPAQQPGRGSVPKRPCVFLLPAASQYLSSGKAHESPGKVGGAGGSLSSEPCSLSGP